MKNKIIEYDQENDILFIHEGFEENKKFKENIELKNIILDINNKDKIKGIEILNAKDYFNKKGINLDPNKITNAKLKTTDDELELSLKIKTIIIKIPVTLKALTS